MIPVTKSFLPPMEEYMAQVQRAYDNQWLTNRGELVLELEQKLAEYLELNESKILCMNNGTIPLQIALKLLGDRGEVITTPFSYIATTAAIVWESCTPVFVDIHPEYLTIDETQIEAAITDKTTCILATHVFGNPCNVEEIERIAKKHNLKVIYDAAHCFGVKYKGKSIFEYGDVSTCSFHATKLFHTGEGGAVFCKDQELFHQIYYSHNFGHNGPLDFHGLGVNAKISELQAAMGLALLPHMAQILQGREETVRTYQEKLNPSFQMFKLREESQWNYSYFPILFDSEEPLLAVERNLKANDILARRYFFPSLNTLPYTDTSLMPVSEDTARRILCLPLYKEL
ncbi:MAG: DegT/DnrJ/EryC1/StrS family aminotransferase, partial [Bacteroidetes bacterium]|nr:DegT/DnrJ/EryC1/StrS family aminotransferase [Bacteroidota bacterium]